MCMWNLALAPPSCALQCKGPGVYAPLMGLIGASKWTVRFMSPALVSTEA